MTSFRAAPRASATSGGGSSAGSRGVVVHSERGRDQLAELVDPARLRVIPHPVFPSDPERNDDGRTLLSLGIIREYKGLGDAIEATKRIDGARLLVAGDPLRERRRLPGRGRRPSGMAPRLPSEDEVDRALGESTVALFPYRPEIDQSGALLRALGAGVPVVAYDVGGSASRCAASRRVVSCRRATSTRSPRPCASCSTIRRRSRSARAGAERARRELTWDAAAAGAPRALPGAALSFEDLIRRQLDLFEEECADLIADCDAAERAYDAADRDEAEEQYGDYLDLVETGTDASRSCATASPRRWRRTPPKRTRPVQPCGPGPATAVRARDRERLAGRRDERLAGPPRRPSPC